MTQVLRLVCIMLAACNMLRSRDRIGGVADRTDRPSRTPSPRRPLAIAVCHDAEQLRSRTTTR
jgi:hypothetical protein